MNLKIFSYRFAQEILQHNNYNHIFSEIISICKSCPLPVYKDKSEKQKSKDVIQQIINTYFKIKFNQFNWELEPFASSVQKDDKLRADFKKTFQKNKFKKFKFNKNFLKESKLKDLDNQKILLQNSNEKVKLQIEVEMGNAASYYRDYFKFQLSYNESLIDIGVLIVPTSKLASRIDSGLGNFEKVIREIPSANLSFTLPILVIGLDDTNVNEIDVKKYTTNMKIVKGAEKKYEKDHYDLVKKLI